MLYVYTYVLPGLSDAGGAADFFALHAAPHIL